MFVVFTISGMLVVSCDLICVRHDPAMIPASSPMTKDLYHNPLPMPEYGGMRVDPWRYPLVASRIMFAARTIFGPGSCPIPGCDYENPETNCCPKMATRMEVGDIRYANKNPKASALLKKSDVSMKTQILDSDGKRRAFELKDIADGIGSPYDRCLLLIVAIDAYYNVTGSYEIDNPHTPADGNFGTFKTGIEKLCNNCDKSGIAGMCKLCSEFDGWAAEAGISCTGYDFNVKNAPLEDIVTLGEEVTDMGKKTNLYLLNVGYQRFAQALLQVTPARSIGCRG